MQCHKTILEQHLCRQYLIYHNIFRDNGQDFSSSIYQKIKPGLEGAINLAWNSSNNVTHFGIGAKYNLDNDASIRAKVNSNLQIGLGYQHKLRDGE